MSKLRALWQASVNATKRAVVWNSEDLFPPSERFIFNFNSKDEVKKWHLYSDSEYGESGRINFYTDLLLKELLEDGDMKKKRGGSVGGKKLLSDALKHNPFNDYLSDICIKFICHGSTPFVNCLSSASLEITDGVSGGDTSTTGVFSGNLSLDMSEGSPWRIRRSGFCGMRSKKFDGFIDLDSYDTIAMKLRGDGRCYISTIYTENWVNSPGQEEDNSWQAFVYVPQGSWRILKIPLDSYLPTWKGNVIEDKLEMNPSRVVGMSLSLNAEGGVPGAKTGPGDFRLEVDWIKALRAL